MRNKYFIWFYAAFVFIVGVLYDFENRAQPVHMPASLFTGFIAILLAISGTIYYFIRIQQYIPLFLLVLVDICVAITVLIPGGLVFNLIIDILNLDFPSSKEWGNYYNSYFSITKGVGRIIFVLVQFVAIGLGLVIRRYNR